MCSHALSYVELFATPWTVACQATLSMEFSRQVYWSGLPFSLSGDLPNPGLEPTSPCLLHCRQVLYPLWVGKIPWRRERLPTPVFLPGEFHGQSSLVGYSSPWDHSESDMTERLTLLAISSLSLPDIIGLFCLH